MSISSDTPFPFPRLIAFLSCIALALGACTTDTFEHDGAPECGDGIINGGDVCDGRELNGATCSSAGFDEGVIRCSSSCTLDTTHCYLLDEDEDQLVFHDELYWGTDPTNPDTDGDGILDGVEYHNGADPLLPASWPGHIGIWPNRAAAAAAAGVTATTEATHGFEVGDVIADRPWVDQNGNSVSLYQFYGYVTVLSVGDRACPPCRLAAQTSQQLLATHLADEVIMVEQLVNGVAPNATAASVHAARQWADTYGLMYPVVVAPVGTPTLSSELVPIYYILDRELRVANIVEGYPGDALLSAAISAVVEAE